MRIIAQCRRRTRPCSTGWQAPKHCANIDVWWPPRWRKRQSSQDSSMHATRGVWQARWQSCSWQTDHSQTLTNCTTSLAMAYYVLPSGMFTVHTLGVPSCCSLLSPLFSHIVSLIGGSTIMYSFYGTYFGYFMILCFIYFWFKYCFHLFSYFLIFFLICMKVVLVILFWYWYWLILGGVLDTY